MFEGRKVIVVVPAFNEEKLIDRTLDTMPAFVDRVIVVDDASTDATGELLQAARGRIGPRLIVIRHERNGGVGAAIVTGYRVALQEGPESGLVAVMAGDAQMDPEDLPACSAAARPGELHVVHRCSRARPGDIPRPRTRKRDPVLPDQDLSGMARDGHQSRYTVITWSLEGAAAGQSLSPRASRTPPLSSPLQLPVMDVPIRPVYKSSRYRAFASPP